MSPRGAVSAAGSSSSTAAAAFLALMRGVRVRVRRGVPASFDPCRRRLVVTVPVSTTARYCDRVVPSLASSSSSSSSLPPPVDPLLGSAACGGAAPRRSRRGGSGNGSFRQFSSSTATATAAVLPNIDDDNGYRRYRRPSTTSSTTVDEQQVNKDDDENDDDDKDDDSSSSCRWLTASSRHCQTCACPEHEKEKERPDEKEARSRNDNNAASWAASSTVTSSPSSSSPSSSSLSESHEQQRQQQQQQPQQLLASRLMDLMSTPSATTVLQQPVPAYSVKRRVLPSHLTSLNSSQGRQFLMEAMAQGTAASYLPLTLHFANQSDPAFCGVTTLLVVLNALSIDPNTRWKGGWRYFGDEESLLARCCLPAAHVQSSGITVDEFQRLASCQGLRVEMYRAHGNDSVVSAPPTTTHSGSLDDFRRDVVTVLTEKAVQDEQEEQLLVVSFGRSGLQQTGDGHFSPIGAYHKLSDQVLVLDVARFKYPPYWVSLKELHRAMTLLDDSTKLSRGWFVVTKPKAAATPQRSTNGLISAHEEDEGVGEDRRPAHLVPPQKLASWCPMHKVKVEYCRNNPTTATEVSSSATATK